MTFIGIQFLIWAVSGLYMVTMDIHYIHGETLIKKQQRALELTEAAYSLNTLVADYPQASGISLVSRMDDQVFVFSNGDQGKIALDAATGVQMPAINESTAQQIARFHYAGVAEITATRLITSASDMPTELSARHLPVWQVTFDELAEPTFYINQNTGILVIKRHNYWRIFDWMWRFHIMDYDDGENVSNWFLFVIALLGISAVITGAVLTYYRVFRSQNREAA